MKVIQRYRRFPLVLQLKINILLIYINSVYLS
jgi:hypothetical protein